MKTDQEILTDCLCDSIKIASPSASISQFTKQYFGPDIRERISDIPTDHLCTVMKWAATQPKFKPIFIHHKPHHMFCEHYNQISFEFDESKNKPEKKEFKSTACKENNWGRPEYVQQRIDETKAYCDSLPDIDYNKVAEYWQEKLAKEKKEKTNDPDITRRDQEGHPEPIGGKPTKS